MKGLFIYPVSKETVKKEHNNYIRLLTEHFREQFNVVNGVTDIGLLDALKKFRKTDVYYFNWIEDVATKRYGLLQVALLGMLLLLCKLSGKKVIWFVHNNISHSKRAMKAKKTVVRLMRKNADLVLSHSSEIKIDVPVEKLRVFHHPLEAYKLVEKTEPPIYDLLIWGSVAPYKGVAEFVEYLSSSRSLPGYKILIAGKFSSDAYYNRIATQKPENITLLNEFVSEEQLAGFFAASRFTLFTYTSDSVLSSAALCKSLSYGQEVIAPNVGSFKELATLGLVHTYSSFSDLEHLLPALVTKKQKGSSETGLHQYVENTSWPAFTEFVVRQIYPLFGKGDKNAAAVKAPVLSKATELS